MTILQLYLLFTVLPGLLTFCQFGIFGGVLMAILTADATAKMLPRICLGVSMICMIGVIFIPNGKQIALIITANYITNAEKVKAIPEKALTLLNDYLDKALEKK